MLHEAQTRPLPYNNPPATGGHEPTETPPLNPNPIGLTMHIFRGELLGVLSTSTFIDKRNMPKGCVIRRETSSLLQSQMLPLGYLI